MGQRAPVFCHDSKPLKLTYARLASAGGCSYTWCLSAILLELNQPFTLLLIALALHTNIARWATAQRRAMLSGLLSEDKLELLQELGFESDEDEAEWLRWFMDLARCVGFMVMHEHRVTIVMCAAGSCC